LGQIQASTSMWPGYPERLEVYGEKGSLILEGGRLSQINIQGMEQTDKGEQSGESVTGSSDPMAISHEPHRRQIEDFATAVRENRVPLVDGREGRKSVQLIEAIYRSARSNQPVRIF